MAGSANANAEISPENYNLFVDTDNNMITDNGKVLLQKISGSLKLM